MKYRKLEPTNVQALCCICHTRKQHHRANKTTFYPYCNPCRKKLYGRGSSEKRKYVKIHDKGCSCSKCGFVAIDSCQLDIDHIDGNHHNNDPNNLQTLCANCHRLKTKENREGLYRLSL